MRGCAPRGIVPGHQVGRAQQLIGRVRHELLELPPRCARPQPVHPPSADSRVTWSSPISTPGQRTKVEPGRKSVRCSSGSAPCHGCAIRQEPQRSVTVTHGCSSDPTSACVSPAHARPGLPIFQAGVADNRAGMGRHRAQSAQFWLLLQGTCGLRRQIRAYSVGVSAHLAADISRWSLAGSGCRLHPPMLLFPQNRHDVVHDRQVCGSPSRSMVSRAWACPDAVVSWCAGPAPAYRL